MRHFVLLDPFTLNSIHYTFIINFYFEREHESRPNSRFTREIKFASKFRNDHFGYDKSQSYLALVIKYQTMCIDSVTQRPKKFKQRLLVFLFDANSLICHHENQLWFCNVKMNIYKNFSLISIINRISYDIQTDLYQSLRIANYHHRNLIILFNIWNMGKKWMIFDVVTVFIEVVLKPFILYSFDESRL